MQTLGCWGVVDQFHFQGVGLSQFEACKPENAWTSAEKPIASNSVELIVFNQVVHFVSLGFCKHLSLELNGLLDNRSILWHNKILLTLTEL